MGGPPRSVSVEIFRKCAPVVSGGHGDLHLFFRLRCGGVLYPGRVGEGGFRCVFTPGMFFCLRALVVSGGGRGFFFTGISGSHRGIFFPWYRQRKQRSRVVYLLRSVQWLPAARTASRQVQEAFLFLLCWCCERCLYLWRLY